MTKKEHAQNFSRDLESLITVLENGGTPDEAQIGMLHFLVDYLGEVR